MSMFNRGPLGRMGGGFNFDADAMAGSPVIASFFNAVYGWMAAGLGLTALVAYLVAHNVDAMGAIFHSPILLLLFVAQIILVLTVAGAVNRVNANVATVLFLLYSALNGLTLCGLFMVYAQVTLVGTFLVTAVTFAAMSLYGMMTQRNLTSMGNLLFMLLIGLVIASVVNIFFANSTLYWLVTYGGVIIFVGLTAYDTQRLKGVAMQTADNTAMAARYSVVGALVLYLDFINLFLFMLRIMGNNSRQR